MGLFLSLSVILGSTICYSQEAPTTGKVEGVVTGKEGENIAAAKIIITNRANKQSVATTTNSATPGSDTHTDSANRRECRSS